MGGKALGSVGNVDGIWGSPEGRVGQGGPPNGPVVVAVEGDVLAEG